MLKKRSLMEYLALENICLEKSPGPAEEFSGKIN
jgi:hypothetical protein